MCQSLNKIKQEALKYKTRGEFQKNSRSAYMAAWRMNILDEICSHMNSLYFTWSKESLYKEAKKYRTKIKFKKANPSAYAISLKREDFEQICSHMKPILTYWTESKLELEAQKYKTRTCFQKNSHSAYMSAWNKGTVFLNRICSHMKKSNGSSFQEQELFDIIKRTYPNIKKMRDSTVKIKNRSYIKRFEIDIFIPSLNKGIEFDGTYYHSFEFMRKDGKKILWSDEDIRNYHEIKDQWFLSKGIQILHIKEEDWIKDKEECFKKCLEFLEA